MIPQPPRKTGFFEHYEELIGTWTRRLRNRQQPRAYLHQTARNIAVDGYRRDDRRDAMAQHTFDQAPPDSGDPEHFMHAVQLADSVERALAELPLNCRRIFIWQKIEGLTQQEIAERLGLSKNMVEKYMIRTLRHLRDRLDAIAP